MFPGLVACFIFCGLTVFFSFSSAAEAFRGYSLVWPLYVAANAETVPQDQRDWLFGRLAVIGTKFGLSYAQVLVLARKHILTCGPMFP